jgi:SAM-dependent methyltransferase
VTPPSLFSVISTEARFGQNADMSLPSDSASLDPIKGFFDLWSIYDLVLDHDYMFHRELYGEVARTLVDRFGNHPFRVLDLGCGSGRHLAPVLQARPVARYEGHDLSPVAISHARKNFGALACPVHFGEGDLRVALREEGGEPFDLIFTGFTLHHFTAAERTEILRLARRRLAPGGLVLVLDSMRDEGQTREAWLDAYCGWIGTDWRALSQEGLAAIFEHIRGCDQPGTLAEHDAAAVQAGFTRSRTIAHRRWHRLWACE